MWRGRIQRRATAYGTLGALGAGNFGQMGLFNDSQHGKLLSVLCITPNTNTILQLDFQRIQIAPPTVLARGLPLIAGTPAPSGYLYTGSSIGGIASDFVAPTPAQGQLWSLGAPLAVIRPGWALLVTYTTANTALNLNWLYQVDDEEDFTDDDDVDLGDVISGLAGDRAL